MPAAGVARPAAAPETPDLARLPGRRLLPAREPPLGAPVPPEVLQALRNLREMCR